MPSDSQLDRRDQRFLVTRKSRFATDHFSNRLPGGTRRSFRVSAASIICNLRLNLLFTALFGFNSDQALLYVIVASPGSLVAIVR